MQHVSATTEESPGSRPAAEPRRHGWRGPAALAAAVVAVVLLLAAENLEALTIFTVSLHLPGIDKVAHVGQYATVFLLIWWVMGRVVHGRVVRAVAAASLTLLMGTSDELFQRLVAYRTFDLGDLAANGVGVLLGVGLAPILPSRRLARVTIAAAMAGLVAVTAHSYLSLRHVNRGLLYTRAGDMPRALEQYRLALRDGVDTPEFYNALALVEVDSGIGDPQAAVVYGRRALAATPHDPDVIDTYGWALHRAGRSQEALPLLERAFDTKPGLCCIHYHLGEVYAALGERARAEQHLREQIRRFPDRIESRRAAESLRRRGIVTSGRRGPNVASAP